MSSILDALDKARRDRARALGQEPPPPAGAAAPREHAGAEGAARPRDPESAWIADAPADLATAPTPPPRPASQAPIPETFARPTALDAGGSATGRSLLIGAAVAVGLVAVIAVTAVAVGLAMKGPDVPDAGHPHSVAPPAVEEFPAPSPVLVATPTAPTLAATPPPAPLLPPPTPAPAAAPTPDPERGIVISDLRFGDAPPPANGEPTRHVTLTPAPTPRVPLAPTGETAQLIGETPPPTPSPTPAPPGLVISRPKSLAGEVFAEDFTPFVISAIMHDGATRAIIVRGRQRHEGETIEGYTITTIDKDRVLLDNEGTTVTVRF